MPNSTPAGAMAVAAVATVYRPSSHADVIVSRWLEPREADADWGWPRPRTRIATMYVAQRSEDDMAVDICRRHDVPLYDSVADALCRGGGQLAVDAVLLIGEHGDYPSNELGQHLYPRKELFDQITAVFRASGRAVPVFCDKHLSWNFAWAQDMVRDAEALGCLLFSGSSIPHCRRHPRLELTGTEHVHEAVVAFYGGDEAYGYHSLEFAQAILEGRRGGETGIASVAAYRGADVWRRLDEGAWSRTLMDEAIAAMARLRSDDVKEGDVRANCGPGEGLPTAFCLTYADGMRVTHLNLTGHVSSWSIALDIEGESAPRSSAPHVGKADLRHPHFATLARLVEDAFISGQPAYPTERGLLTTGALAAAMHARATPGTPRQTPELAITYRPADGTRAFSLNRP